MDSQLCTTIKLIYVSSKVHEKNEVSSRLKLAFFEKKKDFGRTKN